MQKRSSCTSLLVGRLATADGSVMIGRNEDSKAAWPKNFVVHPTQHTSKNTTFVSKDNGFRMDLPKDWLKYTATPEWTDQYGLFEEDGINELGVAMSATESAYANARVLGLDPLVPDGIAEEAMVTVVLPFIHTAKEGVLRLGQIVAEAGTSESNGILFADHDEAWYMETGSGHLWVAMRIPDEGYAVVANQLAIPEVDLNSADFLYHPDLPDFCRRHHLWQPNTPLNFAQIFGTDDASDRIYNYPRVWDGQRLLSPDLTQNPNQRLPFIQRANRPLFIEDATAVLGAHFQETPFDPAHWPATSDSTRYRPISLAKTQEAHILQLRPHQPKGMGDLHWLAMGVAAESVFVPFYSGLTATPPAYQIGNMTFDPQSAYWQAKQLSVLVDSHFAAFMPELKKWQDQLFSQFLNQIAKVDAHLAAAKTATAQQAICTRFAQQTAALVQKKTATIYGQLLIEATDASPLNFKTDSNL